jgi:hypothetical protein
MRLKNIGAVAIAAMLFISGCNVLNEKDDDSGDINTFPMKVGSAWVYDLNVTEDNATTTTRDTLYLFDSYEDYFVLSSRPNEYASLMRQSNQIMGEFGFIEQNGDVNFSEENYVWCIYETYGGYVHTSDFPEFDWAFEYVKIDQRSRQSIGGKNYNNVYVMTLSNQQREGDNYEKYFYNSDGLLKIVTRQDDGDGSPYIQEMEVQSLEQDLYPQNSVMDRVNSEAASTSIQPATDLFDLFGLQHVKR